MPRKPKSEVTAAPSADVARAVAGINATHAEIERLAGVAKEAGEHAACKAICQGLALIDLKAAVPHGSFKELFPDTHTGTKTVTRDRFEFSSVTGRRYMRAARRLVESRGLSLSRKALADLRLAAVADPCAAAETAAARHLAAGRTLRQIYFALGIIRSLPGEILEHGSLDEAEAGEGDEIGDLPQPLEEGDADGDGEPVDAPLIRSVARWKPLCAQIGRLLANPTELQMDLFRFLGAEEDDPNRLAIDDIESALERMLTSIRHIKAKKIKPERN